MKCLISIFVILSLISCQDHKNLDYVLNKYTEEVNSIKKMSYEVIRIDTFSQDFIMNRSGNVLIEKNTNDSLLGMSFYAKSSSANKYYLYDKDKAFEISKKDSNYTIEKGYYGFLGSPGGQLISENLFFSDSVYTSVKLENLKNNYKLHYYYANDSILNITDIRKTFFFDKHSFLPSKIITTSIKSGYKRSQYFIFNNIRVNNEVVNSIKEYKSKLQKFKVLQVENVFKNSQIGKKITEKGFLNLDNEFMEIQNRFPALISFWESWCAPCIRSLPKIDKLQKKYGNSINIIGITMDNHKSVINLLSTKKIKFLNLKGMSDTHNNYEISNFPTYFLINEKGVIIKEYFSFSDKIESDIKKLLE
ncbi:MAG: TlpA family protein disulfide reductase [Flavobacteriaceae bacterium]|nr:TlpA family protein disulfide reductase [Flavobacteriaceae bacterium]